MTPGPAGRIKLCNTGEDLRAASSRFRRYHHYKNMVHIRTLALVVSLLSTLACTQASVDSSGATGGGGSSNSNAGGSSGSSQNTGGSLLGNVRLDGGTSRPNNNKDADTCKRLDKDGNCICMAIASLGKIAHYGNQSGAGDSTDAFQAYMNGQTKGTAKMDLYGEVKQSKKPFPLTADFLSKYDVLILQALEDGEYGGNDNVWTFSQDEINALSDWVNNGGGLITMTGYGGNTDEVKSTNQLLSFAGISYNTDDIFTQCPDNTCYCRNSSLAFGGWKDDLPLTSNLDNKTKQVGVFHGRSINCSDCQIMATDGNTKVGVHKEIGKGRVFVWGDEWVTYTSQWKGDPQFMSQSNCDGETADKRFNVPQFWYNVFRWVSGDSVCFQIDDPQIIIY
jgi:hypothetical protein